MSEVFDAVLDNVQVPHQPFIVVTDSATFSGLPLFIELLRRSLARAGPTLLITVLHSPSSLLSKDYEIAESSLIDFTDAVPGYSSQVTAESLQERILSSLTALGPSAQVFVDALDVLSEDYSPTASFQLVRSLLAAIPAAKPPSRLTVLLPQTSPFLPHLLQPSLSPTLTLLTPHHPSLLTHLSRAYLTPIHASPSAALWQVIERARDRRTGDELAWSGSHGVEISVDWKESKGAIVQILVRKAVGGTKGISRHLSALKMSSDGLRSVALAELVQLNPMSNPAPLGTGVSQGDGMDVPFNLSLTDEQRRRRGDVPLPYAHEGEGAGPVGGELDWGDEEDEDDEEI